MGAAALSICGILLLTAALVRPGDPGPGELLDTPWVLLGLPLLLGLDNLFAGIGLGALGVSVVPAALALGLLSSVTCLAGFVMGGLVNGALHHRARIVGGAAGAEAS